MEVIADLSSGKNQVIDADVYTCIKSRENLIERLSHIVKYSHRIKLRQIAAASRDLVSIAKDLQDIGLKCVQRIVSWTLAQASYEASRPTPFIWNGEEYLCKMLYDLDFVVKDLADALKLHSRFSLSDPLFIKKENSSF